VIVDRSARFDHVPCCAPLRGVCRFQRLDRLTPELTRRYADVLREEPREIAVVLIAELMADKHYLFGAAANGLEPTGEVRAPRTYGVRLTKSW